MDFDLSRDHELIRRTAREFAVNEAAPVSAPLELVGYGVSRM